MEKITNNIKAYLIAIVVLLIFNFIGTCTTKSYISSKFNELNKSDSIFISKIDNIENKLEKNSKELELILDQKFLDFTIKQYQLNSKELRIEEVQKSLQKTIKDLRNVKNDMKNNIDSKKTIGND